VAGTAGYAYKSADKKLSLSWNKENKKTMSRLKGLFYQNYGIIFI